MKNPGPCAVCSFVAHSHTPCNRCVRFATTVASGHATLATKRTLLLTWAGLPPAGSHQLCLAHSFDHLIGASEDILWDFQPQRFRNRHVDRHVELRGLLDRQIAWLRAAQNLVHVIGGAPEQVWEVGSVGDEPAGREKGLVVK